MIDVEGNDSRGTSGSRAEDMLVNSRQPHSLANGRGTFLGFRNTKELSTQQRQALRKSRMASTTGGASALQSTAQPLVPDGGLSPCIIRVLGVGGGGCNAVRTR